MEGSMKTRVWMMCLLASVLLFAFGVQSADFEQVQKERKDLMASNSSKNKALRAAAKAGNMAEVEQLARELASDFSKIANPDLFPKGSGEGTRAKPAVWENWADFEKHAQTARKLALAVAAQAKAGNVPETQTLANALFKQACNNCHDTYRGPKVKKSM